MKSLIMGVVSLRSSHVILDDFSHMLLRFCAMFGVKKQIFEYKKAQLLEQLSKWVIIQEFPEIIYLSSHWGRYLCCS